MGNKKKIRGYTPNKYGCKVSEDVCLIHCEPLACKHGCEYATPHKCPDKKYTEDVSNEP